MKNKNQVRRWVMGGSGNAADLLSAIKKRKTEQLLAAKIKERKSRHQYLGKCPQKKNPTWSSALGREVASAQHLCSTGSLAGLG